MTEQEQEHGIKEIIWPPSGMVHDQEFMMPVHCKPKLIPLKSVTLEKLERMQHEAIIRLRELESAEKVGSLTDSHELSSI